MTGFDLGGKSSKNFSFGPQGAQPGASITGTVLDMAEVQRIDYDTKKPEFWDNGDPKMQYRVTLATDERDPSDQYDKGERDLYLDGRRKANDNGTKSRLFAVLDAVRQATGGQQLQKGGRLTVKWVSGMGFSGDPRNYEATYQPPAMDLGGQPQATQQQAPPVQQIQQQAPAPAPQQVAPQYAQTPQGPVNTATGELAAAPAPQQVAPQYAQTPQGPVNTATGELAAAPAPQPPAQQPPAAVVPTQEQVAAIRAAGMDPTQVWPGYQAS